MTRKLRFGTIFTTFLASCSISMASPGGNDCTWLGVTPPDNCDLDRRRIEYNVGEPPVVSPTTVAMKVDDFDPEFVLRNESCTSDEASYNEDFEVQRTETWDVTVGTTVEIASEMRASVSVHSVGEVGTGIQSSVSHSLEMGFSTSATVRRGAQSGVDKTVPPKHEWRVIPFVYEREYIVTKRVYARRIEYRVDCGGPIWTAFEGCGITDVAAYAKVISAGANLMTELEQIGQCDGNSDSDQDGIPDHEDSEMDGDGWANEHDPDIDGDGVANENDWDMDGDGIANEDDESPRGKPQGDDIDGDGKPNHEDEDMDGDGKLNEDDEDMDGDNVDNKDDPDADGDGEADGNGSGTFWDFILALIMLIINLVRLV